MGFKGSRVLRGRVCNISQSGMFIELPDYLWISAHFSAWLALEKPLRLECVVSRIVHGHGMGVIITIPEEERKRFQGILCALGEDVVPSAESVTNCQGCSENLCAEPPVSR
jgi:hypothetical protein